jgi:hypothetical protein
MNPEFQRNLWLEASPRRAAWVAVSLVLIYGAVALVSRDMANRAAWFAGAGGIVFIVCAIFWAGRVAGTSVLAEVAERTWDFQRLSALSAWQMTWGKLFGATLLASGAGLSGIVVFLASGHEARSPWTLLMMLAIALLVQCLSFMAALVGVRKARAEGRLARAGGVAGGLVLAYFVLSGLAASRSFNGLGTPGAMGWLGHDGVVSWWGMTPSSGAFWSLTLLAFALFALAGAWRLMRLELQMAGEPVVWPIFLVFLAAWVAGFSAGPLGYGAAAGAAAMAMCLAAYAAAFVEPADRVALRRFATFARQGKVAEATRSAPAAVLPLVFAVILTLIGFGLHGMDSVAERTPPAGPLLAFLVRDLGVIALFRFGPRPQRGDFAALVALALLYGVGGIVGRVAGGAAGAAIFAPTGGGLTVLSIGGALGLAAIAWVIAAQRIRAPETSVSASPSGPTSAPA